MNEELNYDVGDCSSLSLELDPGSSLLPPLELDYDSRVPLLLLFSPFYPICVYVFLGSVTDTIKNT